jgi:hypothetical protein
MPGIDITRSTAVRKGPRFASTGATDEFQNALSLQKPNPSVAKQATPRDPVGLS